MNFEDQNTMTDELKSRMTDPFLEVVLGTSEVVISNNHLESEANT